MILQYYTKHVYSKELCYFANSQAAQDWWGLTGRKTINLHEMERLTKLTGVTFERVFGPEKA